MAAPATAQATRGGLWAGVMVLGFGAVVVMLLLYLAGFFSPKIKATTAAGLSTTSRPAATCCVKLVEMPVVESAVGSIRAVHETTLAAKLTARVTRMELKAGQTVHAGDLLLQLDDRDIRAKQLQAQAGLAAAEAQLKQAQIDEKRVADLIKAAAANQQEYERVETALRYAEAEVQRNRETLNEAVAVMDYATITAPFDGLVVDKRVDVGDTVIPGQVLAALYDPSRMQLIATVRESLALRLQLGQTLGVQVDALGKSWEGEVSEIVPESLSASHSFQVKVTGPCPPGIYPGMFGRLLIPNGQEQVVLLPVRAVRQVGQIELVDVVTPAGTERRAVRSGRTFMEDVEILAGLKPGECVAGDAVSAPEGD